MPFRAGLSIFYDVNGSLGNTAAKNDRTAIDNTLRDDPLAHLRLSSFL